VSPSQVTASLLALASAGIALGVRLTAWPLVRVAVPSGMAARPSVSEPGPMRVSESLAATLVARDPFRLARRPAPLAYDPQRLLQPSSPPSPKPVLALVGIVWDGGRNPTALIEGFPGLEAPRSVRPGETIAGWRVTRIAATRVIIAGLDTTWTLTVREPWR
jgi:hypothetical protein